MTDMNDKTKRAPGKRQPCPAWKISIFAHVVILGLTILLVPALVIGHKQSFGPPIQFVERIIVEEEQPPPKPLPDIVIPEEPPFEIVMEPVVEFERDDSTPPVEGDVAVNSAELAEVSSSLPVAAVGLRTRPQPRPAKTQGEPVVVKAPPTPVAKPPAQPPPPPPPAVRPVTGPSRDARVVSPPRPRFPERQRRAGRSATVTLLVRLGVEGKPVEVKPLDDSVHPDFISAAISAARNARYEPALVEGTPVASEIRVRIRFQLR